MAWDHQRMPRHVQLMALPDDGIAVSNSAPGRLGKRWRNLLEGAPREARDRVLRGRNYARRGRLRCLDVTPGTASAEVCCDEPYRPTIRARTFGRSEWRAVLRALTDDLNFISSLLEGELPADLVERLEDSGISLLPTFDELSFDCDCGDYVMPCTHVATVFHVLTDALDGDPFQLLTLRGRSRDHLLSTLRSDWGDDAPLVQMDDAVEEAPPEDDWFGSPTGLPDFSCVWTDDPEAAGAGLRALGPPPGEKDLNATLVPLYEAGHEAVRAAIDAIPDREVKRRPRPTEVRPVVAAPAPEPAPEAPAPPSVPADEDVPLTDRLVELIALAEGVSSAVLARELGTTVSVVRAELVDLLELGLVYRAQSDDGVLWHLG